MVLVKAIYDSIYMLVPTANASNTHSERSLAKPTRAGKTDYNFESQIIIFIHSQSIKMWHHSGY